MRNMLEKQKILRHFNTGQMYPSRLDAFRQAKSIIEKPPDADNRIICASNGGHWQTPCCESVFLTINQ
ncbi:MAG: hypothetical protein WBO34_03015 [Gammaproteobacteria bacterium]